VRQKIAGCRLPVKLPAVANTWCDMTQGYAKFVCDVAERGSYRFPAVHVLV
jgi:hypothetical protein